MLMIYIEITGWVIFAACSIVFAAFLRKYPTDKVRVITTMILHHIGLFAVMFPLVIGIFYPGVTAYDKILGIPSLPFRPLAVTIGAVLVPASVFFLFTSLIGIGGIGHGGPAIDLTKNLVDSLTYKTTRNPMSLGFYAGCLALGLLAGSTYFTLWTIVEIIPLHILYLKIFEELELEMRFGQPYIEYKKRTPFLIPHVRKSGFRKSPESRNKWPI